MIGGRKITESIAKVRRAEAMVVLAAIMFGTTGTAQALGPQGIPPAGLGAARLVLGGAMLAMWAPRKLKGNIFNGDSPCAMLAAVVGIVAYQPLFFAAVQQVGVAFGTVITIGTGPFIAGVLSWLTGAGRPGNRWLAATTIGVSGVAILLLSDAEVSADVAGASCALGAGAAYAVFTVALKSMLSRGAEPAAATITVFALAGILSLPLLLISGAQWLLTPGGLAVAAYLAIFPTALSYVLYLRGLNRLPATTVTTLVLAEPVTATFLGVAVLGEGVSVLAMTGAVLVLLGLLVVATDQAARHDIDDALHDEDQPPLSQDRE